MTSPSICPAVTHDSALNPNALCVIQVQGYKERWVKAHEISKEWVARMTTLVECWNKLDGNVGELSSWVTTKVFHPTTLVLFVEFSLKLNQILMIFYGHHYLLILPGLCCS